MILAVLVLNVAGFDRVSDIEHLESDAGLCAMVKRFEPKLLGMSRRAIARRFRGGRCFPSARSLRGWPLPYSERAWRRAREGHGVHPAAHGAPRVVP